MTGIKTNIRDGAYVALGACALGVAHFSKKKDEVKAKIEPMFKDVTPKIKDAGDKVGQTLSPLTTRISPVANNMYESVSTHVLPAANSVADKVSTNIGPVANEVVKQVKCRSEQAIISTKKIADEAKKRVS